MSRKHYIEAAKLLEHEYSNATSVERRMIRKLARELGGMFKRDNPNFSFARFCAAIHPELERLA